MAKTVEQVIREAATRGVQSVTTDGTRVDAMDVEKLIAADRHLKGATGATKNHMGLRFVRLDPPGGG